MGPLCSWWEASGSKGSTLTIGAGTHNAHGEVCLEQISSFSRLADAERFAEAALVETHRRGVEQATAACAVQDGAPWLQGLVDYQRADTVRILDFAHAGAAQCGLQSTLEADLGHRGGSSTSTAHQSSASREKASAEQCSLDPRVLGSTPGSAVPVTCPSCHLISGSSQCGATRSSSCCWLFLA